ncbi:MAG: hypothetical protein ABH833_04375 [Parcubacteria group bacterium]
MITGEIFISTTWAASTSYIPFEAHMPDAHDVRYGGTANRGRFATTAYLHGLWENEIFEDDMKAETPPISSRAYVGIVEQMGGLGGMFEPMGNSLRAGTVISVSIRKLKALRTTPNRSGVQVNRRLLKGNRLIIRYMAQGELVRPI